MGPGAIAAVNILFSLLDRATQISALIKNAQSQNRDITAAELDALVAQDNAARDRLQAEIDRQRALPPT